MQTSVDLSVTSAANESRPINLGTKGIASRLFVDSLNSALRRSEAITEEQ